MYKFKIDAIHCMSCYRNIDDALKEFDSTIQSTVDIKSKLLSVETSHPVNEVKKLIEQAGYPITQTIE